VKAGIHAPASNVCSVAKVYARVAAAAVAEPHASASHPVSAFDQSMIAESLAARAAALGEFFKS
jgi:hypothetical protein